MIARWISDVSAFQRHNIVEGRHDFIQFPDAVAIFGGINNPLKRWSLVDSTLRTADAVLGERVCVDMAVKELGAVGEAPIHSPDAGVEPLRRVPWGVGLPGEIAS